VTSFATASSVPSETAAAHPPKSFLDNKPLSIGVFALVGIVVVIIVIIIITTCVRKRTRNRLHSTAASLSFDPVDVEEVISNEKLLSSGSRSSHRYAHSDQASLVGSVAPMPGAAHVRQEYRNPHGVVDSDYDVMPNPYTMYGNPAYQSSRSPTYGAGATGNGYQINNAPTDYAPQTTLLNNSRAPTHAPPVKDMGMARVPPSSPLPDTFGDNDIYGRATRLEYLGAMNVPQALRVANE